ncbi:lipocalin family protein [Flavobacterium sp.]|uniref:lipocalin family protein n=1 Tax=Flavobacterium sp. TaxID=239 RepID=UPI00403418C5
MRNLKMLMLAAAGCCALVSCSDDDSENANAGIAGTYRLTAWNAPVAVDFNDDGTANVNLMNETSCYNNSDLILHRDGTYDMTYNYVNIDGTVSCGSETTTGTWTRTGNTVTTTHLSGGQNVTADFNYASGNQRTLTRTVSNWNYPSIDGNDQVYAVGSVNMVLTKQ